MRILNWDDVKTLAALEKDEDDYPVITLIESSVIAAIESILLRTLKKITTEQYFYTWSHLIAFNAIPIISITNISTDEGTVFTTSDYKIREWGVELNKSCVVDSPLTINYTGGFTKIPDDIYRAILLQTVYEFQNKDHIGATSVQTDGGYVSLPQIRILEETKRLIKNYKHPLRGFL